MTDPTFPDPPAGTVLGALAERELFEQSVRGDLTLFVGSGGDWFDDLSRRIVTNPHLEALLSAAREAGREEERERIAIDLARADTWADPTGQWTADQAEAASRQKAYMAHRVADGAGPMPEGRLGAWRRMLDQSKGSSS